MAGVDTDLEILDRWCSGDSQAGNELVQRYFDSVYGFFKNKVGTDTDELIQRTFLACVRSRDQFRKDSSFRTYLFTIARHELYGYLRQRRRSQNVDMSLVSIEDLGTSATGKIARGEQHQLLLRALRTLAVEQQVMLELHYWENMESAELAEIFGLSEQATRARLSRARKALRAYMEKMAEAPLSAATSLEDLDAWARRLREQTPHRQNE